MKAAILAAMLGLPSSGPTDHYEATAEAIQAACWRASGREWTWPAKQCAAMLVTLGFWESRFSARIQRGECRLKLGECDAFEIAPGRYRARARTMWQFQKTRVTEKVWAGTLGVDAPSLHRAAWAATVAISFNRARCGKHVGRWWPEAALSGYATGYSCKWGGAIKRARTYRRVVNQL